MMKLKPCPFCGRKPSFRFSMDKPGGWTGETGYTGHYAVMNGCCNVIGNRTELFFTRPGEGRHVETWKHMCNCVLNDWNRRTDPVKQQMLEALELAWYELNRIHDKHSDMWALVDCEAAESVIANLDEAIKAVEGE